MNLVLFNKVNSKDQDLKQGNMYSEWVSLSDAIQNECGDSRSVLDKFSVGDGKSVAASVVKQLTYNLGITQPPEPSLLTDDREVQWCMEVICHGLSLPLNEPDVIRDCVNVYCDWLSALHPKPKISVPRPICEDPNMYARRIISHFHNLFVPRKGEGADTINRQAVLCHRVLRTLQHLAQVSSSLDRETWEALLIFLLSINNTLLAPPTVKDDVGDQLCERVLSVLLEVWLIACVRCFPSPPLWKTLREMAMMWRHRTPLIEQWNRVNLILTARLLDFMYGPSFPELKMSEEDMQLIPSEMSNDCIAQSWYRFLHTIGNPVDLCRPHVISQTRMFLQYALTNNNSDPTLHPCLSVLPINFLKAIKGIASQVDAFLGIPSTVVWEVPSSVAEKVKPPTFSPTPPSQRRISKSFSVSSSAVTKGIPKASLIGITSSRLPNSGHPSTPTNSGPSSTSSLSSMSSIGPEARSLLASARPKCNSILRLFGEWLFEAAQIGSDLYKTKLSNMKNSSSSKRPSSVMIAETASISSSGSTRKGSGSLNLSQPNSLTEELDIPANLTSDRYQSGRAEALGALCRIFCSKKTGEEVHPLYLAKFYIALQQGLRISDNRECDETLACALLNSSDLLRLDLDGVHLLVPFIIDALEIVLPEKELKIKSTISKNELRRASINLLLSMLVLPLHFQNMVIKELNSTVIGRSPLRFIQLKPRLMNLLINALQVEKDPQNTQMLLGGLLLSVQDSAIFEDVEQSNQLDSMGGSETASNLLSSDSMSTFSLSSDYRNHGHDGMLTDGSLDSANFILSDVNDYPYFLTASNSKNFAHALFRRATDLVCHCLIYSWKTELNVSLAALELLSGLAQTHIKETDAQECKIIVKWICDYISNQCSRPPPAHSKDLHSTIVAAFQCTSTWLIAHPYLLQDKESLSTVLEVVELGISGSKSMGKPGEPPKLKDEKDLKPASMRVRDAAEALLTVILEQVGNFPSPCGAESISCLLDEFSLVKHCNLGLDGKISQRDAINKFRYFIVDNAIMLALLEDPLSLDEDPQPTITVLVRSPFGRYAWTLQLRFLPRYRSPSKHHHSSNPGRPIPIDEPLTRQTIRQRYFSDIMERIPPCKIDQSIPKLESFLVENVECSELCQLIDQQHLSEKHAALEEKPSPEYEKECAPPSPCNDFQTARLFLSHFGFLARLDEKQETPVPPLITLDCKHANFSEDLRALDCVSERTHDTCHVFYVRANQKSPTEILNNVLSESMVSPQFFEILHSLGWPVAVGSHPGWTGHVRTSWKISDKNVHSSKSADQSEAVHGGCLYNGKSQVLYWADASSEIAFVVPTLDSISNSTQPEKDIRRSPAQGNGRTHSPADSDNTSKTSSPHISESNRKRLVNPITTLMLVWLESFEDHLTFPIEDLLPYTDTGQPGSKTQDSFIIYLHALNSGLLRVKLVGPPGRMSVATPLVDGMVISRRVAGTLVRQTALNMCRRRRLDSDSYHPPHVRRRLKIQEIANKYHIQMTPPELLTYLINQNS
nr:PREDICTED: ral GTPase-activating protein subunit beta isoform X2 [Bemisia tabaci]